MWGSRGWREGRLGEASLTPAAGNARSRVGLYNLYP
jgi:hypothetical protein